MTISAKRFTFLDQETNVAVSDFLNPEDNSIYNSPNLEALEMDADMEDFLEKSFGSPEIILDSGSTATDDLIRQTRDAFGGLKNVGGLTQAQIDRAVMDMFPGNSKVQSAYKQLSGKCRTGPMGRYNAGRPYNPSLDCNGRNKRGRSGGCSPNGIGNVLDALTNSQYSSKIRDLNQALANLVALATTGYNANLCGVFGALSGDLDKYVSSRGAGMLLGSLGLGKNLGGVFDLAGAAATRDLHVTKEFPGGISGVLNNLALPFDSRHRDMPQLNMSIDESMDAFDDNWRMSSFDSAFSTEKITQYSGDYDDILSSQSVNRVVDADLDFIPEDDSTFMRMGLNGTSGASAFSGFFG